MKKRSLLVTDIDHATIINWVKEKGQTLSDEPQDEELPEITEIDELQTFVGCKKNKFWIWTRARMRPVPCSARSDASASR